jgi:hypothetical protein
MFKKAVYIDMQGTFIFHSQQYEQEGVYLSTTSNVNVHSVSQSMACNVCVQGVCILFHLCKVFLNAEISDCPASGQSSTGMNKNADAGMSQVPE